MKSRLRAYLEKRADLDSRPLVSGPYDGIDQVVVIPVLAERECLFDTLASLAENPDTELQRTLVLCVVNNRTETVAGPADIEDNRHTLAMLDALVHDGTLPAPCRISHGDLRLAYVDASSPGRELPEKGGVGLARKIGLDWGVAVLEQAASSPKRLISLDADTRVEPNYLSAIRRFFASTPAAAAAVVSYAHPLDGPPEQVAAIICYELFLRYHVLGLTHARSPYAFPSIGSTMVCTADAYAAVSGMNQRQAGEDFYFLQQLAKTVGVAQIFTTTVHPSSRPSNRVPFGTGRRVLRFLADTDDEYLVYNPSSYQILKAWLALVASQPESGAHELIAQAEAISTQLRLFLEANRFPRTWQRLCENARDAVRLVAQFHRWFDGFRTVKLIHHLRDNGFPQRDLFESIHHLLRAMDVTPPGLEWPNLRNDLPAQRTLLHFLRNFAREPCRFSGPNSRVPVIHQE